MGKEQDVDRIAADAIEAFGTFDTWVNNAGVSTYGQWEEVLISDTQRVFDTNSWGVVYGSRAAVDTGITCQGVVEHFVCTGGRDSTGSGGAGSGRPGRSEDRLRHFRLSR
ncbi:MAG TPA: SDR family NAD(P)-dependent oxidoreductase [Tepidisphaeraceae bacterium]